MLPTSAGSVKSDAQNRLAVLVAAVCSFLGYAIAGRSGALTWAAVIGLLLYVGGWFTSQHLRAVVEGSRTDPLKTLRKIRTAVLIITGLGAIVCLVVLLRRATPETAIASAVFLAGAFAAGQSFALFERSDLSGSLLITAPGAIVGTAARSPLPVVIVIVITWLAAIAVSLTLFHASELGAKLEHSEPAVEQEGSDWWPSLFAKILPVIAVIALLIALLSPLLTFNLPKFERESPTIGRPPQGRDRTPEPGGTASPGTRTPESDSGSGASAGSGDGGPDGGPGGPGSEGGEGDSGAAGDHAGGEPGSEPGEEAGNEPGGEPGGDQSDPNGDSANPDDSGDADAGAGNQPRGGDPAATPGDGDGGGSGGSPGTGGAGGASPRSGTPSAGPGPRQITDTPTPTQQSSEDFDPSLTLPSGEVRSDDTPVMRIKAPFPWYWRGVAFDTYTDGTWKAGAGEPRKLKWGEIPEEDGSSDFGGTFEGRVSVFNTKSNAIFTAYRPESLSFDGPGPTPPATTLRPDMVISAGRPANDITYTVKAVIPDTDPEVLRGARGKAPEGFERYLQVPDSLSPRVFELAAEITKGREGRYETAVAVVEYLRSQASSAERVDPPPDGVDPVEHYLFEGGNIGFSNHLATATAMLLRANGIEARVVSGYVPRTPADPEGFLIRRSDAYDWVEVFFPGSGWVTFDAGIGALKPDIKISSWQRFIRWLKNNWFWLLAMLIVATLLVAAGLRALRRRSAPAPVPTEAQDLLTRLERASRYARLAPQTPVEYARALRWKLLPDDGALAESVLALIAESAYSERPITSEERQAAIAAVERIKHNESKRRGEDDQTS